MQGADLHSTMLLLYLNRNLRNLITEQFTFHYASTLSPMPTSRSSPYCPFTFHYASTLSEPVQAAEGAVIIYIPLCFYFIIPLIRPSPLIFPIYIPLCFYFIRIRHLEGEMDRAVFTFHYASTLSDAAWEWWTGRPVIYIPLCFYFIATRAQRCKICKRIYIPLCFYFIQHHIHQSEPILWFTFHYASTLSESCNPPNTDS